MENSQLSGDKPAVRRVGKYQLLDLVGQGGMAAVYRAELFGPGRARKQVALKLFHPHLSREQDFLLMFLDEMQMAMALAHRNIVQTFDAGQEGGQYFMVMELLAGSLSALRRRLPAGPLPLGVVLLIAAETSAALAYSHSSGPPGGIVHRDVSPGNILLSAQGDVKLADFGVAKAAGRLTVSSADLVKGKLRYMAPEQAEGVVEARSDLYAFGAVIYELLTGVSWREQASFEEIRGSVQRRPSSLSRRRPEISQSFDRLVARCLSPRLEERPAGAAELHAALVAELKQLGVSESEARGQLRALVEQHLAQPAPRERGQRLAEAILEVARGVPLAPLAAQPDAPPVQIEPYAADVCSQDVTRDLASRRPALTPREPVSGSTMRASAAPPPLARAARPASRARPRAIVLATVMLIVAASVLVYLVLASGGDRDALPPPAAHSARPDLARVVVVPERTDAGALAAPDAPPRRTGTLRLEAAPRATAFVDGAFAGRTPLELPLSPGQHIVRLEAKGYAGTTLEVWIDAGAVARRRARLRRLRGEDESFMTNPYPAR